MSEAETLWEQLIRACEALDVAGVERLLGQGANPNPREGEGAFKTPLWAALCGEDPEACVDVIRALAGHGLDLAARGYDGQTAIGLAVFASHVESVRALSELGSDLQGAGAGDGQLPLLGSAAWFGPFEIVEALIGLGAPVNARGQDGVTPLHLAAQAGDERSCLAMLGAGADATALSTFWRGQGALTPGAAARHMGHLGAAGLIEAWVQASAEREAIKAQVEPSRGGGRRLGRGKSL